MKPKTIEEAWNEFRKAIFGDCHQQPSKYQVAAMRKSFFSGAFAMYSTIRRIAEAELPPEKIAEMTKAYEEEFFKFFTGMLEQSVTDIVEREIRKRSYKNN